MSQPPAQEKNAPQESEHDGEDSGPEDQDFVDLADVEDDSELGDDAGSQVEESQQPSPDTKIVDESQRDGHHDCFGSPSAEWSPIQDKPDLIKISDAPVKSSPSKNDAPTDTQAALDNAEIQSQINEIQTRLNNAKKLYASQYFGSKNVVAQSLLYIKLICGLLKLKYHNRSIWQIP